MIPYDNKFVNKYFIHSITCQLYKFHAFYINKFTITVFLRVTRKSNTSLCAQLLMSFYVILMYSKSPGSS